MSNLFWLFLKINYRKYLKINICWFFFLNNRDKKKIQKLIQDQLKTRPDHGPKSSNWVSFIPGNPGRVAGGWKTDPTQQKLSPNWVWAHTKVYCIFMFISFSSWTKIAIETVKKGGWRTNQGGKMWCLWPVWKFREGGE